MKYFVALALSLFMASCMSKPIPFPNPAPLPMQYNAEGSEYGSALYRGWSQTNLPKGLDPKHALDPDFATDYVGATEPRLQNVNTAGEMYEDRAQFVTSQRHEARKILECKCGSSRGKRVPPRSVTRHFEKITEEKPLMWADDVDDIVEHVRKEYKKNYAKKYKNKKPNKN